MHFPKYDLINAEERALLSPDTFEIPPLDVRTSLEVGDFAKVIFSFGERIWIEIDEVVSPGFYAGVPVTQPVTVDIKIEEVDFEAKHVIAVQRNKEMFDS